MFATNVLPQLKIMLRNLDGLFARAEAHAASKKYDANVLLTTRLVPDQYPFVRQVQIACDNVKGCVGRLAGQTPPAHEDKETTFTELRDRVAKTLAYIEGFSAADFNGWEERAIDIPWMPGKFLMAPDYVNRLALPNVYFHIATAYSILRASGVEVGKTEFIGELPLRDKK